MSNTFKWALGGLAYVALIVGLVWGVYNFRPKPRTFLVCMITPNGTECAKVFAESYELREGCAKFSDGSAVCHVIGIAPIPEGPSEASSKQDPLSWRI